MAAKPMRAMHKKEMPSGNEASDPLPGEEESVKGYLVSSKMIDFDSLARMRTAGRRRTEDRTRSRKAHAGHVRKGDAFGR